MKLSRLCVSLVMFGHGQWLLCHVSQDCHRRHHWHHNPHRDHHYNTMTPISYLILISHPHAYLNCLQWISIMRKDVSRPLKICIVSFPIFSWTLNWILMLHQFEYLMMKWGCHQRPGQRCASGLSPSLMAETPRSSLRSQSWDDHNPLIKHQASY